MKILRISALFAVLAVASQASAFGGFSPVAGKPWGSGATSMSAFNWSNWAIGTGTVQNMSTATRTWTVPLDSFWQKNQGQGAGLIGVSMKSGSNAATTAQSVVNDIFGARVVVSPTVSSTSTTMGVYNLATYAAGDNNVGHVVYINYVIPWNGAIGTISPLKLNF